MEDRFQLAVIVCNYFPPCKFWLSNKTALWNKRKEKPKNKHDGQYMTKFLVQILYVLEHYKSGLS
jgi:hypothetical protein